MYNIVIWFLCTLLAAFPVPPRYSEGSSFRIRVIIPKRTGVALFRKLVLLKYELVLLNNELVLLKSELLEYEIVLLRNESYNDRIFLSKL